MNQFVDVPCPILTARGKTLNDGRLMGTRWLHNPQIKRWYMVKRCPQCGAIHKPADIREDRLIIR
jgi:hypothetical protein